jgi:phosphohistidine phosphatase
MKRLLAMRHAKSGFKESGQQDHDRRLSEKGCRDVPIMGQLVCEQGIIVDTIISSTAKRARQTAEKMALACGIRDEVLFERALYLAPADEIVEVLALLRNDPATVLLIAHNPGLESLVARLSGPFCSMSAGALAHLELMIDCWAELTIQTRSQCLDFWLPGEK